MPFLNIKDWFIFPKSHDLKTEKEGKNSVNKGLFLQEEPKLSKPGSFGTLYSLKPWLLPLLLCIYTTAIPWMASSMLPISEGRFLLSKHQRLDINKSILFILNEGHLFQRLLFPVEHALSYSPASPYIFLFFFFFLNERPPHCQTSNTTSQMARTVCMFSRENRFKSFLVVLTWGLFQSNLWLVFNGLQSF